jgi:acyl-CoA synthetase (NDP forming)
MIPCLAAASQRTGGRVALLASIAETLPEKVAISAMKQGILPLCGLRDAQDAIVAATKSGKEPSNLPITVTPSPLTYETLDEATAKHALKEHGLAVAQSAVANSAKDAACIARDLGFPVVLKGIGIAHKTEVGAVALDLSNTTDVENSAHKMPCDTFLVETMITGIVCELLVGVTRDEAHGFVLTLGAGGVWTELMADTQSLLIPATPVEIKDALDNLRISPLLSGYRGEEPADFDAIIDAVMSVQNYVQHNAPQLIEVEINPLMCLPKGAIAADALITKEIL